MGSARGGVNRTAMAEVRPRRAELRRGLTASNTGAGSVTQDVLGGVLGLLPGLLHIG